MAKGPKTSKGKARAIANLIPAKKGEVRNPKGRPTAGLSVREWMNVMQDWTREKLKALIEEGSAPVHKVAAARAWLDATSMDRNAAGSPIAGADLDRIFDRTDGKPTQSVVMTGKDGGAIETKHTTETKHTVDWDELRSQLERLDLERASRIVNADGPEEPVHSDHAE